MTEIDNPDVKCWKAEDNGKKYLLVKVGGIDDLIIPENLIENFKQYLLKFNG